MASIAYNAGHGPRVRKLARSTGRYTVAANSRRKRANGAPRPVNSVHAPVCDRVVHEQEGGLGTAALLGEQADHGDHVAARAIARERDPRRIEAELRAAARDVVKRRVRLL